MPVQFTLTPPLVGLYERILLIGGMGTRKSSAICTVIEAMPDRHFHILDADDAYLTHFTNHPKIIEQDNYTLYTPTYGVWPEIPTELERAAKLAEEGDFLIYDCLSDAWPLLQKHAKDSEWWRLDKNDKPVKGDLDWSGRVNPEFDRIYTALRTPNLHVIVTSDADPMDNNKEDKNVKAVFGPYGLKPRGQKTMWRHFHSNLIFTHSIRQEWEIQTARERGARVKFDEVEMEDSFAQQYLVKAAGWKKTVMR